MAFIVRLTEGSATDIDLFYIADDGFAMLDRGLIPNDPARHELWGGYLENALVRQEDGKREIPLRFQGEWTSVDAMIDAVNALEKRLRHAARYRVDGWGDEVFLRFQLHNSTFAVDFPVSSGAIDKADLMNACSLLMDATDHREAKRLTSIGLTVTCGEPYWESTELYSLENYVDNPAFWRGALPGDSWTEVDPAANLTLAWETSVPLRVFMGRSLKWTIAPDAVNDVGIHTDNIAVTAGQTYYAQGRGLHTAGCDTITFRVYDVTNGAPIAGTTLAWNNGDDAWETLGASFTAPALCVNARIEVYRANGDSTAGNKTFYCDAFLLDQRGAAPIGWCSGRNLTNELDAADQINVLCVAEVPGEVEAETELTLTMANNFDVVHVAKRTRDDPHDFIWQLLPCGGYTTAEGGAGGACVPGLIDAACIDSDKIVDVTSPSGSHIAVSFVGNQNMVLRCYWGIGTNLINYYGKFAVIVLAKAAGAVDTITMQMEAYQDSSLWSQGAVITQTVPFVANWRTLMGWQVISFPMGEHDDDLWDTGNYLRIRILAAITGAAAWDVLQIAGVYLVALDERYLMTGGIGNIVGGTPTTLTIKQLDGDRGAFIHRTDTSKYYSHYGAVGSYPKLTPEIENWLYFISSQSAGVNITDAFTVGIKYRPRGIFLRGTNP